MTALSDIFTSARAEGRAAFVGYLPAGYPTADGALENLSTLARHADLVEVGIPFSDPMMDGPTIQAAGTEALSNGFRVHDTFAAVEAVVAAGSNAVIMSYWNPILQYGVERFAADFAEAGGAGVITPDLIPDEADEWIAATDAHGVDRVFLVAPSSTPERLAMTLAQTGGFVYVQAVMGVTGARDVVTDAPEVLTARVRELSGLACGVGLGVRNGDQAAEIASYADGVIVGSALITAALEGLGELGRLTAELAEGVRRPGRPS